VRGMADARVRRALMQRGIDAPSPVAPSHSGGKERR
jgi:hypothetical protein